MIFQHFNLPSSRIFYENLALPLELAGVKRAAIEVTVLPLLELTAQKDRYPAQISGGQKQRVGIARWPASPRCCCRTRRPWRSTRKRRV